MKNMLAILFIALSTMIATAQSFDGTDVVALTALPGDEQVTLRWTTTSEQHTAWFEIKRDGQIVGHVAGAGSSTIRHEYEFVDHRMLNSVNYTYELLTVDENGTRVSRRTVDAVPQNRPETASKYALYQNTPNPFNPTTRISFDLLESGNVKLTVFDMLGRSVATLVNGTLEAGKHSVMFDGAGLPSSMYIYRIEAGAFSAQRKMLLLK